LDFFAASPNSLFGCAPFYSADDNLLCTECSNIRLNIKSGATHGNFRKSGGFGDWYGIGVVRQRWFHHRVAGT